MPRMSVRPRLQRVLRILLESRALRQPDRRRHALETVAPAELPSWMGQELRLSGVRAFDRQWDVRVTRGQVEVEPR